MKQCKVCEKEFVPKKYAFNQIYCSLKCNNYMKNKRLMEKRIVNPKCENVGTLKNCLSCGNTFEKKGSVHIFCSIKCQYKGLYKRLKKQRSTYGIEINKRIRLRLSYRLWFLLKKAGLNKKYSIMKHLGCNIKEFKSYLRIQFDDKMTFENYGKYWHIDHIKPCSSYDLTKEQDINKCFHYTNLQPLPAKINMSKQDKKERQEWYYMRHIISYSLMQDAKKA